MVGGGTTTVYVRTTDNPEKEDALVKIFKVTGKIHFLDGQGNANAQNHFIQTSSTTPSNGVKRYMVLDKEQNIKTSCRKKFLLILCILQLRE